MGKRVSLNFIYRDWYTKVHSFPNLLREIHVDGIAEQRTFHEIVTAILKEILDGIIMGRKLIKIPIMRGVPFILDTTLGCRNFLPTRETVAMVKIEE